jgi:hypothetical protein
MVKNVLIVVLGCMTAVLSGCNGDHDEIPIWEQVKITDLAPSTNGQGSSSQFIKTINFDIYTIEIPAENIDTLETIWPMLHTKPILFNNQKVFKANSFVAGFGQIRMWDQIRELLTSVGGRNAGTLSLLIPANEYGNITIARLRDERNIFYTSPGGSPEAAATGPGKVILRIMPEIVRGERGVCTAKIVPVFSPFLKGRLLPPTKEEQESNDIVFKSVCFVSKMSPGAFVLLGPEEYIDNEVTLGGFFFSRFSPRKVVRIYSIFCTGMFY